MTGEFDPIEDWLSTDVELMPPRPGSYQRIHSRARRRKGLVAMSAAAGVAVVIAAAVTLPQVASGLLPGHGGGGPDQIGQSTSTSASPAPSGPRPTSTGRPSPSSSAQAGAPSAGLSITGSSAAPAPGFAPASVTFVNQSVGAVLGYTTDSCPGGSCATVAGTSDYGQSWNGADAPPAGPPDGGSGVSQIRFLDPENGWAFGPALYATHDGGATWTSITGLPGRVIDLATVDGSAFAVVASCTGSGQDYASGCTRFRLYSTPYAADNWQPVPGAAASLPVVPGGLQLTTSSGYLLAGSKLFTGSPSGGAWHEVSVNSGPVPACLRGQSGQPGTPAALGAPGAPSAPGALGSEAGLIAPGASGSLYLLCQAAGRSPALYQSADGGQTWQLEGQAGLQGQATSLAVAPGSGTIVVATSTALYYSPDARTWHRASLSGQAPAGGFGFVGMTTTGQGVAVPADVQLQEIYLTTDGGTTWHPQKI